MSGSLPLAVLISGRGSNMVAIATACQRRQLPAHVELVISDNPEAAGLRLARDLGIETRVLPPPAGTDREAYGRLLAELLQQTGVGLIVLAGFMRILAPTFVDRFAGQLLNIHPSLLPSYPGLHTHQRVLEAGDRVHGCTVHFVTAELDAGPRIIQARVPVLPGDDETSLSARVQRWEHIIYPESIGWFAQGRLQMREGYAWLDGHRLEQPVIRGDA